MGSFNSLTELATAVLSVLNFLLRVLPAETPKKSLKFVAFLEPEVVSFPEQREGLPATGVVLLDFASALPWVWPVNFFWP